MKFIKLFENWMEYRDDEEHKTNFSGQKSKKNPNKVLKDRFIHKGQKVKVFRNLNTGTVKNRWEEEGVEGFKEKEDILWSIRDNKNVTIHHTYQIWLKDCTFPVTEGNFNFNIDQNTGKYKKGTGRRGVLQKGNKEIHAFVLGEIVTYDNFNFNYVEDDNQWVKLFYNPEVLDVFVVADTPENRENGTAKRKVLSAEEVIMAEDRLPIGIIIPFVLAKNPILEDDVHQMKNPTKDNWKETFDREEQEYNKNKGM
jgi:hypothetical protein